MRTTTATVNETTTAQQQHNNRTTTTGQQQHNRTTEQQQQDNNSITGQQDNRTIRQQQDTYVCTYSTQLMQWLHTLTMHVHPTTPHLSGQCLARHLPSIQHQGMLSKGQLRGANEAAAGSLHRVTAVHICVDQVLVVGHKHMLQRGEPAVVVTDGHTWCVRCI